MFYYHDELRNTAKPVNNGQLSELMGSLWNIKHENYSSIMRVTGSSGWKCVSLRVDEATAPFSRSLRQPCCCSGASCREARAGLTFAWRVSGSRWLLLNRLALFSTSEAKLQPTLSCPSSLLFGEFTVIYAKHITRRGLPAAAERVWASL